jgi:uncharacterized membrane protein YbjE (DUF340 family)
MKNSLIISLFFLLGIFTGIILDAENPAWVDDSMRWSLYALMLVVGIAFGSDPKLTEILRSLNIRMLLLPLLTVFGTFTGIAVYLVFFDQLNTSDALAISSGFGYYSLSSIIIREFSGSEIAVIALLSNVFREIITLLTAPFLVKIFGKAAPICSAGATSMDTTLPVITRSSGKNYLLPALIHGIILTILVPVIITIIYKVF